MDHAAIRAGVESFMQTVPSSGQTTLYLSEYHPNPDGAHIHQRFNKELIVAHMQAMGLEASQVLIVDERGTLVKNSHRELYGLGTYWKTEGSILVDANQINVDFAASIIHEIDFFWTNGLKDEFGQDVLEYFMRMFEMNNVAVDAALEPINYVLRFVGDRDPAMFLADCLLKHVHFVEERRDMSTDFKDIMKESTLQSFNVGVVDRGSVQTKTIGLFDSDGPRLIDFVLRRLVETLPGLASLVMEEYWAGGDPIHSALTVTRRLALVRDHFVAKYVNESEFPLTVVIMGIHHFENMTSLLTSPRVVPKEWYTQIYPVSRFKHIDIMPGNDEGIQETLLMYVEDIEWTPPESLQRSSNRPAKKARTKLRF